MLVKLLHYNSHSKCNPLLTNSTRWLPACCFATVSSWTLGKNFWGGVYGVAHTCLPSFLRGLIYEIKLQVLFCLAEDDHAKPVMEWPMLGALLPSHHLFDGKSSLSIRNS